MASIGPNIAGTGENDSAVGTLAWTSPDYITANDTSFAYSGATTRTGNYLKGTNFGFAVPAEATIDGVQVTLNRYSNRTGTRYIVDNIASLVVGGSVSGDNKADTVTQWGSSNTITITYGAVNDLWGCSLSPSIVNASNFGFVLSHNIVSASIATTAYVNYISIAVTYTEGGGGASAVPVIMRQYRQRMT